MQIPFPNPNVICTKNNDYLGSINGYCEAEFTIALFAIYS